MASSFEIHARSHWSFRLVLLGSKLQLEGYRHAHGPSEALHCSTWLNPQDAPHDVAHALMEHPCCCVEAPAVEACRSLHGW